RGVFRIASEFLEGVEDLLVDQISLLDPAFYAGRSPDLREAPLAIEHVNAVSIFCGSDLVVNLGQLVSKGYLRGRDVIDFKNALPMAAARGEQHCHAERQQ